MASILRNFLVSVTALLAAAGCQQASDLQSHVVGGGTKRIADVRPTTGFLPQPGLLTPGGDGQAGLVYQAPGVAFTSYSKVVLDPIVIRAPAGSDLAAAPADERGALAQAFYNNLETVLAKHCALVSRPSPGTLRLRFALVDADQPNTAVNTVATYAPYLSTASSVASFAFNKGVSYTAGSATAEAYAVDASTGKLVWQAVDKRGGTNAFVKDTLDPWVDVNHAFEAWAGQLEAKLQRSGLCEN